MTKGCSGRRRIACRHSRRSPYPLPSCYQAGVEVNSPKKCSQASEKRDWEDATCSVCMEFPHNAVLLLCSSHDKGCRPYMCGTSFRHSNCLDQYKKACTRTGPQDPDQPFHGSAGALPEGELACPLCRGRVKGWAVVEPAREYLNAKKRGCMQENCPFLGTYKELKKHVRAEHPSARPWEVDPAHEQKWRRLEHDREREDVISTIRASTPGAVVFGDYAVEGSGPAFDAGHGANFGRGFNSSLLNVFLLLHAFGPRSADEGRRRRRRRRGGTYRLDLDGTVARARREVSPVSSSDSIYRISGEESDFELC